MSGDPHAEHHEDELPTGEKVRRAGHIVLDAVVASDLGGTDADKAEAALQLVFENLLEIDAIELLLDEETEELELDISPLIGGTLLVVRRLVAELAVRDGVDEEEVVMSVRAALDEAAAG